MGKLISDKYAAWEQECETRFQKLKANEEELNRIFIDIYGLGDELTPEVEDKDVTVRRADLTREIKSLVSYAVGCMFGRYSVQRKGLVFAGGEWSDAFRESEESKNQQEEALSEAGRALNVKKKVYDEIFIDGAWEKCIFPPDSDNVIPICDDEYFRDDATTRFVEFVKVVYGEDTLEENLNFVADALGTKGDGAREKIRSYFLNDFYADHCKIYQKRPIYWLFSSGKKHGFKALMYIHRYRPDTVATVRTNYVHELQERYHTQIEMLESQLVSASGAQQARIKKQLEKLRTQSDEIAAYEPKVKHLADSMIPLDLDDGVKNNYEKLSDILEKIK